MHGLLDEYRATVVGAVRNKVLMDTQYALRRQLYSPRRDVCGSEPESVDSMRACVSSSVYAHIHAHTHMHARTHARTRARTHVR